MPNLLKALFISAELFKAKASSNSQTAGFPKAKEYSSSLFAAVYLCLSSLLLLMSQALHIAWRPFDLIKFLAKLPYASNCLQSGHRNLASLRYVRSTFARFLLWCSSLLYTFRHSLHHFYKPLMRLLSRFYSTIGILFNHWEEPLAPSTLHFSTTIMDMQGLPSCKGAAARVSTPLSGGARPGAYANSPERRNRRGWKTT